MILGLVGAGALGTLYGASLARDVKVRLLARSQRAADAIVARGGLQIEGDAPVAVIASHDPRALLGVDVVVVAVKSYDSIAALSPLRNVLDHDIPIVSLQNGLEFVAHVERALGARRPVALAPTTEAALSLGPGLVRRTGRGTTTLGWASGREGGDELETLAALFNGAALSATTARPIEPHVWAKAIANAAINPLTALAGVSNGEVLERPDLARRLFAIAREGGAVAEAVGIVLPFNDAAAHVASVIRATAANRSSMLQDLASGRQTEIDDIAGAIVRTALRYGVAVPETTRALDEVRARAKA